MPMITAPGSLWDNAKQLYLQLDRRIRFMEQPKKIIFPAPKGSPLLHGAVIQMAQMQHESDRFTWQGTELTGCLFEEATQFEESQITYLFSRMRSHSARDSYIRMTCNPDSTSFLRSWLVEGGYVCDDTGYAFPEMSGKIRYFVRRNGKMVWGDSPQELAELLNDPDILADNEAMSFTFIASSLEDNPMMLSNNPRYKASLKGLPEGERRALLEGNWNYTTGAKELFDREWVHIRTNAPAPDEFKKVVRFWDRAGTKPHEGNRNPDWTVGVLMGIRYDKDRNPQYWILDVCRFRDTPKGVKSTIAKTSIADQEKYGMKYSVILEQDPGQAGKSEAEGLRGELMRESKIKKVKCRQANKAKKVRFKPFSTKAEERVVYVLAAKWSDDFFNELEIFTGEPATTPKGAKDDQADSAGGAINELIGVGALANFKIGSVMNNRPIVSKPSII